jgi:dephospho-CoA kinase
MIRIGIVGKIGSGKSYVAKQFGYPVFNADEEVAKLYKKNRQCFKKLKRQIPKYISSFPVKKTEISEAIIKNPHNLKKIVEIIHPEVKTALNKFVKKNKHFFFLILDIPLLIENKLNRKNDVLVFVDAKDHEINKRLKKRFNYNGKIIKKFKKLQLSVEYKKKKSDFVIKNNFKVNSVKKNVKNIINNFLLNV